MVDGRSWRVLFDVVSELPGALIAPSKASRNSGSKPSLGEFTLHTRLRRKGLKNTFMITSMTPVKPTTVLVRAQLISFSSHVLRVHSVGTAILALVYKRYLHTDC